MYVFVHAYIYVLPLYAYMYIYLPTYVRPVAQPTDAVDTVGIRIPTYHTRLANAQFRVRCHRSC